MVKGKILNLKSSATESGKPKLPSNDVIDYGEIAINYAKDVETFSIKNADNEIVTFQKQVYVGNGSGATQIAAQIPDIFIDESEEGGLAIDTYTKSDIDTKVTALKDVDSGLDARLTTAEASIATATAKITELVEADKAFATKTELASVDGKVTTNTNNIATLSGTVGTHTTEISGLTAKVGANASEITAIKSGYTKTFDFTALSDRVTTVENTYATTETLNTVSNKVDTNAVNIAANTIGLTNTSNKANKNETDIADIKDAYTTKVFTEDTYAKKVEFDTLKGEVDRLVMKENDQYGVAAWGESNLSNPDMIKDSFYGSKEFLLDYDFYLIDVTQNSGEAVKPVGKLKRGNLLRFADGRFAPTIGITAAQKAECDVALYLDAAHNQPYCGAGQFNAEVFYNEHGMADLYDANGAKVRVLRPWETTETKYTIGIARNKTVYLLDNVSDGKGKKWKGVFSEPTVWNGIDTAKYALPPTAFSPCPMTTKYSGTDVIGNVTPRNFLYVYEGDINCKSSKGVATNCTMFSDQKKSYPRTNDVSQVSNMQIARRLNADATKPYPFAEGGHNSLNEFITAIEVAYGTNNFAHLSKFTSGISSRDACTNDVEWKARGGVRVKVNGTSTWNYYKFGDSSIIYYNNNGGRVNLFETLVNYNPMEACMESQMAASFANERNIAEGAEFEFYGYKYSYKNVPNTTGIEDLNVIVYKVMSQTFDAYNASKAVTKFDVEVNLRMALVNGVSLCGNIWGYYGGGLEMVGTCKYPSSGSSHPTGNTVDLYFEQDQKKWHNETSISKDNLGKFAFESAYEHYGQQITQGYGSILDYVSYNMFRTKKAVDIDHGACAYQWDENYWSSTVNQRVRIRALRRCSAHDWEAAPRTLHAYYAVSATYRNHGGSCQCLLAV